MSRTQRATENRARSWTQEMLDKHVPAPRPAPEDKTQKQGARS